jgi:hypothetical protein
MTTVPFKTRDEVITSESLAIGSSAESLATAGATIPENTGDIVVTIPSGDSMHVDRGTGTPTVTVGIPVTANNVIRLTHAQQSAKFISDDGSDVTVGVVYFRGSGRQDKAHSKSEPL